MRREERNLFDERIRIDIVRKDGSVLSTSEYIIPSDFRFPMIIASWGSGQPKIIPKEYREEGCALAAQVYLEESGEIDPLVLFNKKYIIPIEGLHVAVCNYKPQVICIDKKGNALEISYCPESIFSEGLKTRKIYVGERELKESEKIELRKGESVIVYVDGLIFIEEDGKVERNVGLRISYPSGN
jgi:hypothetical protein